MTIFSAPKYAPKYAYLAHKATNRLNSPNLSATLFLALQVLEQCLQHIKQCNQWKKCEQCKQFIHIIFNILVEMKMMKLQNRDQTLKQTGTSAEDSADVTFLVW